MIGRHDCWQLPWRQQIPRLVSSGLALLWFLAATPLAAQGDTPRKVRSIETGPLGLTRPAGLAFSPRGKSLLVLEQVDLETIESELMEVTLREKVKGTRRIQAQIKSPVNMTFDGKTNRLLIYQPGPQKLVIVEADADGGLIPSSLVSIRVLHFGLNDAQGMTVDPDTGVLYMLDAVLPRILRIEPDFAGGFEGALISEIDLSTTGLAGLKGLAIDPETGHFHILSPGDERLYEVSENGLVLANRDLSGVDFAKPEGMVFALSGDLTDDPAAMSLYIADRGSTDEVAQLTVSTDQFSASIAESGGAGQIAELSLDPMLSAQSTATASLVQVIDASQFSPPSLDTAGIGYLNTTDTLLVSDSEVNEMPIFTGDNLFDITAGGILLNTLTTISFSDEPTGVAVNPANGHWFFSDDTGTRSVYELDPGDDGLYNTLSLHFPITA